MLLSLLVFLSAGGGVVSLSLDYWPGNPDFWVNLLAEAQEGRVDPLLFGCLLLWFDRQAERHRQVKRYRNAISDVLGGGRGGHVPDCRQHPTVEPDRSGPGYPGGGYLAEADLKGALLMEVSLTDASRRGANLQDDDLSGRGKKGGLPRSHSPTLPFLVWHSRVPVTYLEDRTHFSPELPRAHVGP